jgi:hypothetical protein
MGTTVGKKVFEQAGYAALNFGIEFGLDKLREQLIQSFKKELNAIIDLSCREGLEKLGVNMDRVYQASYEEGQAERIIGDCLEAVFRDLQASAANAQANLAAQRLLLTAFSELKNHLGSRGSGKVKLISQLFNAIDTLSKVTKLISSLQELASMAPTLIQELNSKLDSKKEDLIRARGKKEEGLKEVRSSRADFDRFKDSFASKAKSAIVNELMTKVQHQYVTPAVQTLAHSLLNKLSEMAETGAKKLLRSLKNSCSKEVQKIMEYQEEPKPKPGGGGDKGSGAAADEEPGSPNTVIDHKELDSETKLKVCNSM